MYRCKMERKIGKNVIHCGPKGTFFFRLDEKIYELLELINENP